jgi:hypothetical protein
LLELTSTLLLPVLPAKVFGANTDLDYTSFVDAGDAHILEKLIINFALARVLDHDALAAVNQRPEFGRLGCLAEFELKVKATSVLVR